MMTLHLTDIVKLLTKHYGEDHVNFMFKKEGIEGLLKETNDLLNLNK